MLHVQGTAGSFLCLWAIQKDLERQDMQQPAPVSWDCRMCKKGFPTKAALSVHFFAVHQRRAEYRRFLRGTKRRACNTESWTSGRLQDHLRAGVVCVHKLAGLRLDSSPAGYRNKQRRMKRRISPLLLRKSNVLRSRSRSRGPTMSGRRRSTMPFAISPSTSSFLKTKRASMRRSLTCTPLYQQEIEDVITRISEEISEIGADPQLGQWSQQQIAAILNALQRAQQIVILPGNSQDPSKTSTYRDFQLLLEDYPWEEKIRALRNDHQFPVTTLFELDVCSQRPTDRFSRGIRVAKHAAAGLAQIVGRSQNRRTCQTCGPEGLEAASALRSIHDVSGERCMS